jgi:hypothetical protein
MIRFAGPLQQVDHPWLDERNLGNGKIGFNSLPKLSHRGYHGAMDIHGLKLDECCHLRSVRILRICAIRAALEGHSAAASGLNPR